MLALVLAVTFALQNAAELPGRGIPESLARERAETIANLRYELSFSIPADRRRPVEGRVIARFTLPAPHRVVFDFAQPAERVRGVRIGGAEVRYAAGNGHLTIPAGATHAGENEVVIDFLAGDESLNRTDEILYTLFVPARARLAFPVFDQPNLKARYSLSLDVPDGWAAVANGRELPPEGGSHA